MIMGLADILTVKVKQRNDNQGMTYIFSFIVCLEFKVLFIKRDLVSLSKNKLYFSDPGGQKITSDFLDLGKII